MKRPCSTKSLPEEVFFTDRDLGSIIPDALAEAGVRVERHDHHFGPTTRDVDWLGEIGRRGWIALTHNKTIRYTLQERDMVMRAGVPLFMLIGHYPHRILAKNLIHTLPGICQFLVRYERPFIAKVYKPGDTDFAAGKPGRVDLWLSYQEWAALVDQQ